MATAKARVVEVQEQAPTPTDARSAMNDFVLLALPTLLFKQLSDESMKRNMTLPQLMSAAVVDYIKKTE